MSFKHHSDDIQHHGLSTDTTAVSSSSSSITGLTHFKRAPSPYLELPSRHHRRSSLDSTFSGSDLSELSFAANPLYNNDYPLHPSHSPLSPPTTLKSRLRHSLHNFYIANYGALLVMISQFFGALMNLSTTLLEHSSSPQGGMHPFQILFVRQSITATVCTTWALYTKSIPDFPFGPNDTKIRLLLVTRGMGGFFGVFGIYYSLLYLPLAEATVLTFLAPILTCYLCSFVLPGEQSVFGRQQQIAALISLVGVIFIAQPATLFTTTSPLPDTNPTNPNPTHKPISTPTPTQHLHAILISLLGVLGATCAMTCIRAIGTRAHPFLSINVFSVWCSLVSLVCLIIFPSVSFRIPEDLREWGLLGSLGVCGFTMQWLLTAGLAYGSVDETGVGDLGEESGSEESMDGARRNAAGMRRHAKSEEERRQRMKGAGTRATSMVYTQMLFALAGDKIFFNSTPTLMSWIGSGFILTGAIWVAAAKDGGVRGKHKTEDKDAGIQIEMERGRGGGDGDGVWMRRFGKFRGRGGRNGRKGGDVRDVRDGRDEIVGLMSGEDDEEDDNGIRIFDDQNSISGPTVQQPASRDDYV